MNATRMRKHVNYEVELEAIPAFLWYYMNGIGIALTVLDKRGSIEVLIFNKWLILIQN